VLEALEDFITPAFLCVVVVCFLASTPLLRERNNIEVQRSNTARVGGCGLFTVRRERQNHIRRARVNHAPKRKRHVTRRTAIPHGIPNLQTHFRSIAGKFRAGQKPINIRSVANRKRQAAGIVGVCRVKRRIQLEQRTETAVFAPIGTLNESAVLVVVSSKSS